MTRRRWVVLSAMVGLLGAAIAAFLFFRNDGPVANRSAGFEVHTVAEPGERERASQVASSLEKLPDDVAAGRLDTLSPEARNRVAAVKAVLPPGTKIAVDLDSWRRTGTVASVSATVKRPADSAVVYLLMLLGDGDRWLLSEAYRQQLAPTVS